MGSFDDIARSVGTAGGRTGEFVFGMRMVGKGSERWDAFVSFVEQGSEPRVAKWRFDFGGGVLLSVELLGQGDCRLSLGDHTGTFPSVPSLLDGNPLPMLGLLALGSRLRNGEAPGSRVLAALDEFLEPLLPARSDSADRLQRLRLLSSQSPRTFPSAPLRSRPKRTYDPTGESDSSEGLHVPMLMMRLARTQQEEWETLRDALVRFGERSGLFRDIRVKSHGDRMSDPFQLQVQVRSNAHANLMDVGYGVSQSLPILVDIARRKPTTFLLQQPEVHLHPRGQAELATGFVRAVRDRGHRFLVETHSDFIVDRVRASVRRGQIAAEDVSILYFQPQPDSVRIHSLHLDDHGNLTDAPEGYRDFFLREMNFVLGFGDES